MVSSDQEKFQRARIILTGSSDQRLRSRACEDLEQLIAEADGKVAQEATNLKDKYCAAPPPPKDREVENMVRRWTAIMGLGDPVLLDVLQELKEKPVVATRLRSVVISALRQWIKEAIARANAGFHPNELKLLNRFVDVISEMDVYTVELEQLSLLRKALFQIRYDETVEKIDEALNVWKFNDAWSLCEQLDDAPSEFRQNIDRLQKRIYDSYSVSQRGQALLEHFPRRESSDWADTGLLIKHAEEVSGYLENEQVPAPTLRRLQTDRDDCVTAASQFIKTWAAAAVSFDGVRDFYAQLGSLKLTDQYSAWVPHLEWFQPFVDRLVANTKKAVRKAADPQAVQAIYDGLKIERRDLPQVITQLVDSLAMEISDLQSNWAKMRSGNEFELTTPALLPVPTAFKKEAKCFKSYLNSVKDGFVRLQAEEATHPEHVYEEVLTGVDSLLTEIPEHFLALKLKERVQEKLLSRHIEEALVSWRFAELFDLCKASAAKTECSYFLRSQEVIRLWLDPVVTQDEFFDWQKAQNWWANLKSARNMLPTPIARELENALRHEEEKRRAQWIRLLESLLTQSLSVSECEAIATSLEDELQSSNLQTYQKRFQQKASIGRAYQHIEAEEWSAAENIIRTLVEDPSVQRLKTYFEVEQARRNDLEVLAVILKNKWSSIAKSYPSPPYELLLEAIEEASRRNLSDVLENLRIVATKVLATDSDIPTEFDKKIASWDQWFRVEQDVMTAVSLTSLRQLLAYKEEHEDLGEQIHGRLERLVKHWEAQDNLVMLIWASNEFDWISLSEDPAEKLQRQSVSLANKTMSSILTMSTLGQNEVLEMDRELKRKDTDWKNLEEYLNQLRRARRPPVPGEFVRAREQVGVLLTVLIYLDDLKTVDLREDLEQYKLQSAEFLLQNNLEKKVAARERLLAEVVRLDPLAHLRALEQHIEDAIRRCRREEDLFDAEVFADLGSRIEKLIAQFELARAEGLPMWRIVSEEYCRKVYELGCIRDSRPYPEDLRMLAQNLRKLEQKEVRFRNVVDQLWDRRPVVASRALIKPENYRAYYDLFPKSAPLTWRDYAYFERRFAANETSRAVLEQSRDWLPPWVGTYLVNGIPACIDES